MFWEYGRREKRLLPIDRYSYTNKLANLDVGIKMFWWLVVILLSMIFENPLLNVILLLTMSVFTTAIAGIPVSVYLKVLGIPMGFAFMGFMGVVLDLSVTKELLLSMKVGNYYLGLTEESLQSGILALSRSSAAISATFFLALTTSVDRIIRKLSKMPIPGILIEVSVLTYRSIFIFLEEAVQIHRSQELRHGYDDTRNARSSWTILVRQLVSRVIWRYEEMVVSLQCRNYDGNFRLGD